MSNFNVNIQTYIDAIDKLSDAEKLKLNQVIWKDAMTNGNFTKLHNIKSGVRNGDKIPLGDKGKGYTFMNSTAGRTSQCDSVSCDLTTELSVKTWDVGRYDCTVEFCYKDLDDKLLDFFNSEACTLEEMSTSVFVEFFRSMIADNIQDSLWVKTYFGEKASSSLYLNNNDGLFVQMLNIIATDPTRKVSIPENANADYATQEVLDPSRGYEVFNAMVKARTRTMKKNKNLVIRSTRLLAENYLEWLRNEKQVICCQKDPTTATYEEDRLTIWGIPIVIVDEFDEIISGKYAIPDLDDGTKWDAPHRAILIANENMPIGTCEANKFSNFELKVDNYNDKLKFSPEYTVGVQILQDEDFVLAI